MIIYKRSGNKVIPYWINRVTGKHDLLTYKQIIDGGDVKGCDWFYNKSGSGQFNYSRLGWEPYYIQPINNYKNPRSMKNDGSSITDNDWFYQD